MGKTGSTSSTMTFKDRIKVYAILQQAIEVDGEERWSYRDDWSAARVGEEVRKILPKATEQNIQYVRAEMYGSHRRPPLDTRHKATFTERMNIVEARLTKLERTVAALGNGTGVAA